MSEEHSTELFKTGVEDDGCIVGSEIEGRACFEHFVSSLDEDKKCSGSNVSNTWFYVFRIVNDHQACSRDHVLR